MQLNRILKLVMLLFISTTLLVQCKKEKSLEENKPPIAKVVAVNPITLPINTIILDGSTSSDPDGVIKTYKWTKVTVPTGDVSKITNSDTVKTTVTGLIAGNYSFKLTVTDNNAASNSTTVNVTVNVAGNQPPVAKAGADQTIVLPTKTVTLDGSASYDPENNIARYEWTKISTPIGDPSIITNGDKTNPTVSGLIAGTYTFKLTVTDDKGLFSVDTVAVTVDVPPVAKALAPSTITLPTNTVTLDGSTSTDIDGIIKTYQWTKTAVPAGDVSKITNDGIAKTTVTGLIAGTYTFQLKVTDNNGASDSTTVSVTVNKVSEIPLPNASGQTIWMPTSTVILDGSASTDYDGTTTTGLTYLWEYVAPTAFNPTITNATTAKPTISGLIDDVTYTFKLTVTNAKGLSASINVKVTVKIPLPGTWEGSATTGSFALTLRIDANNSIKADVTLGGTTRTNLSVDYGIVSGRQLQGSFDAWEAGTRYKYTFTGYFNKPNYTQLEIRSLTLNDTINNFPASTFILIKK